MTPIKNGGGILKVRVVDMVTEVKTACFKASDGTIYSKRADAVEHDKRFELKKLFKNATRRLLIASVTDHEAQVKIIDYMIKHSDEVIKIMEVK